MRQRYLDRITFTASSISTIDLPREHWAKKITLLLDGQCDSGSSVSRSAYNPFDIITRIEIIANGSQTIKSISGGEATFNYSLSASTYYRIVFTHTSGWTHYTHGSNGVLPVNQTFVNWTDGVFNNTLDSGGYFGNAVSIDVEGAATTNKIVQTNTITVSGNLTAYQLYCKKTIAGSGAVQFKISFDNGSSWSSAKDLNTKYTNSTTGTSIKMQVLLNGKGSGNTAEAENYSLMVWY